MPQSHNPVLVHACVGTYAPSVGVFINMMSDKNEGCTTHTFLFATIDVYLLGGKG